MAEKLAYLRSLSDREVVVGMLGGREVTEDVARCVVKECVGYHTPWMLHACADLCEEGRAQRRPWWKVWGR